MFSLAGARRNLSVNSVGIAQPVGAGVKRTIDIVLALAGILLMAPLLIFCFLATFLTSSKSAVFRHRRIGFQGKPFDCYKFRTMVDNAEECLREYLAANPEASAEWATSRKLKFDPRVTALGSILRKTSLDELPQLFNVLKGDMSIVGPRPVVHDELERYATSLHAYYACRPGITGLWQVSGRSSTTYTKRVACDAYYARNWSMMLDVQIVLVTLPALLNSDNAY